MGKKVAYIYKAQKEVSGSKYRVVWGKVTRRHGSNGVVRAKFKTNLSVRFVSSPQCHHELLFSDFLFTSVMLFVPFYLQPTAIGGSVRVMLYPSNV